MDQDVVPVLLAHRHLRRAYRSSQEVTSWLGVEFTRDDFVIDVDLLAYNGQHVYCIECKSNAATLNDAQLKKLITFADSVDARPGVAALAGKISPAQRRLLEERAGVLLGPDKLFLG